MGRHYMLADIETRPSREGSPYQTKEPAGITDRVIDGLGKSMWSQIVSINKYTSIHTFIHGHG